MDPALHARLTDAEVLWLTTVDATGQPQTSPVWFVWLGGAFHVASEPGAGKVVNARARPRVSAHLDGAGPGDLVVTIEGTAVVAEGLAPEVAARYAARHASGLRRLGTTAEEYLGRFSAAVVVTPVRWRVFPSD
jgi:PPOX class probable F420-dependent enzyme